MRCSPNDTGDVPRLTSHLTARNVRYRRTYKEKEGNQTNNNGSQQLIHPNLLPRKHPLSYLWSGTIRIASAFAPFVWQVYRFLHESYVRSVRSTRV